MRIADAKQSGGYEAARDLLANQPRLTALLAANNLMTLGALNATRERALKIPDEISIVGFDDMAWASLLQPPLTAVAQPTYQMGQRAAELLLSRMKDHDQPVVHEHLPTQLIVRGSTGKPRPE